jgi:hypothetical protein
MSPPAFEESVALLQAARAKLGSGLEGLVGLLEADEHPACHRAAELIKAWDIRRRPFLSAFAGRLLGVVAFAILGLIAISNLRSSSKDLDIIFWFVGLCLLIFVYRLIHALTIRFELRDGIMLSKSGVLGRKTRLVELFVCQYDVRQTFINRLTGDVIVTFIPERESHNPPLEARGLIKARDADKLLLELREITRDIRACPTIKGIIKG